MDKNKQRLQIIILAIVMLAGGLTIGKALFRNVKAPVIGDKAPGFSVKGLDGQTYTLAELAGKPVVLNFWGTFCLPCKEEMPALQRQAEKWAPLGVVVVGMNLGEDAATVSSFIEEYGISFPIYMDEDDKIRKQYGVSQYPTTFFIQSDGTVNRIKIGKMDEAYIEEAIAALLASG